MYFSDSNITNPNDDKLNRSKFAKSLAQSIVAYNKEDCLTLALMGKWGSGKTSIIKMFEVYLRQIDKNQIVIYFNPWNFSTRNNLLFQFFDTLSKVNDKKFSRIVNKENLKNFAIFLVNSVAVNFPFAGAGITLNPKIENVSNDEETLNDLKDKISRDFRNLKNNKVIIIIDDIDRLTNIEIQQIFMLVKSLADFPNVRYILSFDKESVVGSLDKLGVHSPKIFIEKIIQIPLTVPEISQFQLNSLIDDYLFDFYNTNYPRDKINLNNNDFWNLEEFILNEFFKIRSHLNPFFKTPRDLYRYINILKFYFSTFKHQVNIDDFMLIVAIQLFYEDIYNYIKYNKQLFLVEYPDNEKRRLKDENKQEIECIINLTNNPNHIKKVLLFLFPKLDYYYHNTEYDIEHLRKWRYNLRACSDKFFYGYFTLTLGDDEISMLEINDLFKLDDSENISNFILKQNSNNKTKYLFDLMMNRVDDISKENTKYFINSLLNIGDLLSVGHTALDEKRTYLLRILHDLLRKYENNKERYDVLNYAISNANRSLYTAISVLSHEDFIYSRFNYENNRKDISKALLDEENLQKLEDILVLKIRNWDKSDKLWDSSDLEKILDNWELWDSEIDVVKRVKEFNSKGKNALRFARRFRNINTTVMHADSPSEIIKTFNLNSMLKYFENKKDLKSKYVQICQTDELTPEEQEICESLIKQINEEWKL